MRPRKNETHNSMLIISKNCILTYEKRFTHLLQNSGYPLPFDTSYKMYWPCMTKHEPISNGDVKIDLRIMDIYGLNGICHVHVSEVQNKGAC